MGRRKEKRNGMRLRWVENKEWEDNEVELVNFVSVMETVRKTEWKRKGNKEQSREYLINMK